MNRGEHHGGQNAGRERGRQPECERSASASLADSAGEGVAPAGTHPHVVESLRGRVQAATAEPAEQLLRPVADEQAADQQAQ